MSKKNLNALKLPLTFDFIRSFTSNVSLHLNVVLDPTEDNLMDIFVILSDMQLSYDDTTMDYLTHKIKHIKQNKILIPHLEAPMKKLYQAVATIPMKDQKNEPGQGGGGGGYVLKRT